MKKMLKEMCAVLLSATLILSLMPINVFAGEIDPENNETAVTELQEEKLQKEASNEIKNEEASGAMLEEASLNESAKTTTSEDVKVLGTSVSSSSSLEYTNYYKVNSNALVGGTEDDYNVKFTNADGKGTLTLKNFVASFSGDYGCIALNTDYEIDLIIEGTNVISMKSGYSPKYGIRNMKGSYGGNNGKLVISGSGSLDMTATKTVIMNSNSSDKFGELEIKSGTIVLNSVNDEDGKNGINVKNYSQSGGSVTINVGSGKDNSTTGIYANQAVSINGGSCNINIDSNCSSSNSIYGIKAGSSISIGSSASSKIVIESYTRTSVYLMNKTPTLGCDIKYGANKDGSSTTTIKAGADASVLSTSKPLRYFETVAAPKYTVTYKDGVDTEVVFEDKVFNNLEANSNTPAFGTEDPERSGYVFAGWDPTVAEKVTDNAVYTAKWKKIHTIKYTDGVDGTEIFKDQVSEVVDGNDIPAFSGDDPTRTGYEFKGWNPEYSAGAKASADVTYVAQWEELYKVTYKDGISYAADKAFSDDVHSDLHMNDNTPAFVGNGYGTTPIREHYQFDGWSPAVADKVSGNQVYTAQWKEIKTTDEVQVFNQQLSLDTTDAYTTYWKAIDITVGEVTKTKLFPSDENDYDVKYEYDPVEGKRELTLKNLQTENAALASTPQSYIFIKSENDVNLVLEGENKLNYTGVTDYNTLTFIGAEESSHGNLTISGTGSLEATSTRTGLSIQNGNGKVTIESGDITLHVHADGQGAQGIRCHDYTQTGGNLVLDLVDKNSGAMANSTGFVGQVTAPYEPGEFSQTGGKLQIKVKTAAQAFGVIGFKKVLLGEDLEDMEIILDNVRNDGSDNWTRLFGLGDDNQEQKCELVIENDSIYGRYPDGTQTIDLPEGEDNDILQYLGTAGAKDKLHYYHQGVKTYTVTYTDNVPDEEIFADDVHDNLTKNSDTPAYSGTTSPTRKGYKFNGWKDADGNDVADKVTKDVTYLAQWEAIKYKVIFNKNATDATETMEDEVFSYDEEKALTENAFVRDGYEFSGWNTDPEGEGTAYTDEQLVKNLADTDGAEINLYAQWKPIAYQVKFNKNASDAKGSMDNQSFDFDEEKALSENEFTRKGYKYEGWNTEPDGTGTDYSDKQSVKNLTNVKGATVNLYAKWTPIGYTVVFDANTGEGEMEDMKFHFDERKNLNENEFTNGDLKFCGWNTEPDGSGTSYKDMQSVKNLTATDGAVVKLYAIWKHAYTVIYKDGVDGTVFEDKVFEEVIEGTETPGFGSTPKRKGYVFKGWQPEVAKTVTGDAVYVAMWEEVKGAKTGDTNNLILWTVLVIANLMASAYILRRRNN